MWVHAKPSQRNRDRHQTMKLIWYNQLGVHALDEKNTNNHKEIRAFAYQIDEKRHNWKAYVLGHKKFQDVQTALIEQ